MNIDKIPQKKKKEKKKRTLYSLFSFLSKEYKK